jgi:mono/diheme cytochrome c family protein
MRKVVLFGIAAALVLLAIAATLYVFLRPGPLPKQANAPQMSATTQVINQGEYLARVGDCVACHTVPNGKPFAGGRAMRRRSATSTSPTSPPTTRPASASGTPTSSTG